MSAGRAILLFAVFVMPLAATASPSGGPMIELAQATGLAPPAPGSPGGPPAGPPTPFFAGPPSLPQGATLPPPLPAQVTAQFFYDDGGKPAGPLSIPDLRAKIAGGAITPVTLVWKAGMPNWLAAKDAPEVAALFGAGPTPAAPPIAAVPQDPNTYLLGTWQSDDTGPPGSIGPARLTLSFLKGGGVAGSYAYSPTGSPTRVSLPVTGFWSAEAAGSRRANLALSLLIQNGPQVQTFSTSSVLDLVDNNTLRDVSDGSLTTRVLP